MAHPDGTDAATGRIRPLDGLRGLAALIVVLHHAALLTPAYATVVLDGASPTVGSASWWLFTGPLKPLVAGGEAVLIFFLLSGLVLVRPILHVRRFDPAAYYPRRLVRLGLPVIASVLLAAGCAALADESPGRASSAWAATSSVPHPGIVEIAANLNPFAAGFPLYPLNNPLWSLRWELVFSLALPLVAGLVVLAVERRWLRAVVVVGCLALVAAGTAVDSEAMRYLPVFVIGGMLAAGTGRAGALARAVDRCRHPRIAWSAAVLTALALATSRWTIAAPIGSGPLIVVTSGVEVVGCAALLLIAIESDGARRLLASRPAVALGRISFSLYLVHVPILIAADQLLPSVPLAIIVGGAASLAAAVAFHRVVEDPSIGLSRWIGDRIASRGAQPARRRPADSMR